MKRMFYMVVGSLFLLPLAHANNRDKNPQAAHEKPAIKGQAGARGAASDELKKHLTVVELYSKSALNNAKAIYQTAELPMGPMDKMLFREGALNVSRDLAKIEEHTGHLKRLDLAMVGQQRQPMAGREGEPATTEKRTDSIDVGKRIDELRTQIGTARQSALKLQSDLGKTDRTLVRDGASALYSQLMGMCDVIRDVQASMGITSLERITPPEKSPVRGIEEPTNGDLQRPMELPRPGEGGLSPTPRPEPVQPPPPMKR
jgi:hypothetical protein